MNPRYKLIIFDIDGTLIDTADSIVKAANKAIQVLDLPKVSMEELRGCIGPPLAKTMISKGLLEEDNYNIFNETFRNIYKNEYLLDCNLYPFVEKVLKELSEEAILAVATNKRYDYAELLLEKKGINNYFKVIKGTDFENKLNKADLISSCVNITDVSHDSSLMVGDTMDDLKSARTASVDFIGVTYGFGFSDDCKPDNYIDNIEELLNIVL